MISDRDVWAAALLIVKRYGTDAMLEAAARADQSQEDNDWNVMEARKKAGAPYFAPAIARRTP